MCDERERTGRNGVGWLAGGCDCASAVCTMMMCC